MKNDINKFKESAVVIGYGNLKGGVGKTKLSIETAYILSHYCNMDVLVINNDKQENASNFFNAKNDKTLADVLSGGLSIEDVIQETRYPRIDVIASDMSLASANLSILLNGEKEQHTILKNALVPVINRYNFIIIDNPPDINTSMFNGLIITDQFVAVANPDVFSLEGLLVLKEQLEDARRYNPNLKIRGCVINKFIASVEAFEIINDMRQVMPLFNTHIRFTKGKVDGATRKKMSIYEYSPWCGFAMDTKKFLKEFLYL